MQSLFAEDEIIEQEPKRDMTMREFYHRVLIIFVLVPLVFALIWLLVK